jgi:hypothetical protein
MTHAELLSLGLYVTISNEQRVAIGTDATQLVAPEINAADSA